MIGNKLEPFKFWCQKVLPNVYDDSLSYYEYLCKMNEYLNQVIEQINTLTDNMSEYETDLTSQWNTYRDELSAQWIAYRDELTAQWQTYKTYIDTYFDNLDVQEEINNKLDTMASDGTLDSLIAPYMQTDIPNAVTAWLNEHVDPVGSAVTVDDTLSISGSAADAKVVGDIDENIKDFCTFNGDISKINFGKVPIRNTEIGYWLNASGMGALSDGYSFNKYELNSLEYLYVDIPNNSSPVVFRFCESFAGNGAVVGNLYKTGYKGFISIPTGAIALFVACDNANLSNIKIYGCSSVNADLLNCVQLGTRFTEQITSDDSNSNYWLNSSGGGEASNGYTFDEFPVVEGETLFLDVPFCKSPTLFRFSNSGSGSSSSVVGNLYKKPFRGFVQVPIGANHIFIARLSTYTTPMCYRLEFNNKSNRIARGLVFINKHNDKIYIKTTSNYYVLLDGVTSHVGRIETSIDDNNNNSLVIATKTGFKRTATNYKPTNAEIIIATIMYGAFTTYAQNVIVDDAPLVKVWYQRYNIPIYFNNKKQKHYTMRKAPSNDVLNCDYFLKITNRYNLSNSALYYVTDNQFINDDYPIFVENNTSIANKKILTIGDSFTKRGWYQQQIKKRENTVSFVGTQTTNHNNLLCEGYSGAKSNEVFGSTVLGNPSPFYNPTTQQIDYEYYATNNNIEADMIVIMFGLNENSANNYITAVQTFINSVKAYDPSIVIYVVQPCIESNQASTTQESYYYDNAQYLCGVAWIDLTDCVKIPMRNCMIDEFDYEPEQLDYGYNNLKINGTHDAVHPSEDVGFKKIGDQIYNWLGI